MSDETGDPSEPSGSSEIGESGQTLVYLDNNATTIVPQDVIDTVVQWMNRGDPSGKHAAALEGQTMMTRFRQAIATESGFELEGPHGFTLIFTSGGSEGNNHVLCATARAYAAKTKKLPHIITSAADHRSVLACCLQLAQDRLIQLTVLPVRGAGVRLGNTIGTVDPRELRRAIRPNTCLVSIIAANPETGAINDLRALGEIAHERQIPFHSDTVQLFGKSSVRPSGLSLDAFTVSFHKFHGPPGVGILALRNDFVEGYGLKAHICGPQNENLRGGIENLSGIAGALAAYKLAICDRAQKNARLRKLRDGIILVLAKRALTMHVDDYCEARPRVPDNDPTTPQSSRVREKPKTKKGRALESRLAAAAKKNVPAIVWLGPRDMTKVLPNTILMSVLHEGFDGERIRAELEEKRVIVGTCDSPHMVDAMDVPPELWPGVLRVSLCDTTTAEEVAAFITRFLEVVSV